MADNDYEYPTVASALAAAATEGATVIVARLFHFENPILGLPTAVTADFSGNAAAIDPTDVGAAITNPDIPRNVTATFGATWNAGNNIKVYGTDQFDAVISETLVAPGGVATVTGAKCFKTVTKVTKVAQFDDGAGNAANTCSIGTGQVLGVVASLATGAYAYGMGQRIGTGFEPPTLDTTNNTVTFPGATLNGVLDFNVILNVVHTVA